MYSSADVGSDSFVVDRVGVDEVMEIVVVGGRCDIVGVFAVIEISLLPVAKTCMVVDILVLRVMRVEGRL